MKKVLVIGGAGYIGSVLVTRLLRDNHVVVLDNFLYNNEDSLAHLTDDRRLKIVRGDFNDRIKLDEAMRGLTDVVLLASLVGDPICKKYPELAKATNLTNSIRLFDRMTEYNIESFVFTSTCSNYGLQPEGKIANEASDLNPQSLYAETKVEFEKYILSRRGHVCFSPIILRLATAFGQSPRMRFDLTISEFTRDLAQGKELEVYDAQTWRPYCHVEDISSTIMNVIRDPKPFMIYNVGSSQNNFTKQMIVDKIKLKIPEAKIKYSKGGDPRDYKVDFSRLDGVMFTGGFRRIENSIDSIIKSVELGMYKKAEYGNYRINRS